MEQVGTVWYRVLLEEHFKDSSAQEMITEALTWCDHDGEISDSVSLSKQFLELLLEKISA